MRTLAIMVTLLWVGAALMADDQPKNEKDKKIDESGKPVMAELQGEFHVHDPVPLTGPVPAVLRSARVGDKILLQVTYVPDGAIMPKKVTARAETPAVGVLEIINSGKPIAALKPGQKAEGKDGHYFAVLLKANSPGDCAVQVNCEMSDGTTKQVPFQFKIKQ